MSEKLRPANADGIEEFDNALPRWWVWLFRFTILFAVIYMAWLHLLGGESIQQEYMREVAALENVSHSSASESETSGGGQAAYATNCLPCHGAAGEGTIGPNLTDKFWIHGGKPDQIEKTIADGVLDKGMPAWKPILGEAKVRQLVSYVITLKGSNPPNPKAAQGDAEP